MDEVGIARVRLQVLLLLVVLLVLLLLLLVAGLDLGLGLLLGLVGRHPLGNELLGDLVRLLLGLLLLLLLLLLELVELLLVVVRGRIEGDGDQERSVGTGPEALGERVVGLPRLRRLRELPVVLLAEAHVERRQRDREEQDHGDHGRRPGMAADEARHPLEELRLVIAILGLVELRDRQRLDPVAQQ